MLKIKVFFVLFNEHWVVITISFKASIGDIFPKDINFSSLSKSLGVGLKMSHLNLQIFDFIESKLFDFSKLDSIFMGQGFSIFSVLLITEI